MNFKNTPNFAFKNAFQPKTINISFKENKPTNNDSDDVCDEIESLLSELENKSAIENGEMCKQNQNTCLSNLQDICNDEKMSISNSKPEIIETTKNEKEIVPDKTKTNDIFEFKLPKKCVVPSFKTINIDNKEHGDENINKNSDINTINQITNLLKLLEDKIIAKEQENNNYITLLDKQTLQNKDLTLDNEQLNTKNRNLIQKIFAIEQKAKTIAQNKEKIQNLQDEVDAYKEIINDELIYIQKQYDDLKEYNGKLTEEKQNVIKQNVDANKKLQVEIDILQQKIRCYEKENTNLLQQQQTNDLKINSEINEYKKYEKMYKEALHEKENIKHKIETLEKEYEDMKTKNDLLMQKQTEMNDLMQTNQKLRQEINEKCILEAKVASQDKDLIYYKFEIQKLQDENKGILEELCENNKRIKEQDSKNKELMDKICKKNVIFDGHMHNFRLFLQNLRKTRNDMQVLVTQVDKITNQNVFSKLKAFYQKKYEFEMKKSKREKMELTSQIQNLMDAHKKQKTNTGFAKIKSKYVEPSDSDIWNVFN